jgi:DNA-binding transcriptional LysR family regulator
MLERQLGAPLFEHGRDWEAAEQAKASQRATLVVGISTSPGRGGVLPAIRSRFTAARPQATVTLRQVSWDDPTAGLADGSADVAFVAAGAGPRPFPPDSGRRRAAPGRHGRHPPAGQP